MPPLDHLPGPLQWFRGTWGSRVAHGLVCAGGVYATHRASLTQPEHLRVWWIEEFVAFMLVYAFAHRERQDYLDGNRAPAEVIGDMAGPVLVFIFVLLF